MPPSNDTLTSSQRRQRARIASYERYGRGRTAEAQATREAYARSRVESRVREIVESAPPLTQAQRDRIAAIVQTPR